MTAWLNDSPETANIRAAMSQHVVIATESLSSERAFRALVSKINLLLLSITIFIIAVPPAFSSPRPHERETSVADMDGHILSEAKVFCGPPGTQL